MLKIVYIALGTLSTVLVAGNVYAFILCNQLESSLGETNSEIAAANEELINESENIANLKEVLASLQSEVKILDAKLAEQTVAIDSAKTLLSEKENTEKSLTESISNKKEEIIEKQSQIEEFESKVAELERTVARLSRPAVNNVNTTNTNNVDITQPDQTMASTSNTTTELRVERYRQPGWAENDYSLLYYDGNNHLVRSEYFENGQLFSYEVIRNNRNGASVYVVGTHVATGSYTISEHEWSSTAMLSSRVTSHRADGTIVRISTWKRGGNPVYMDGNNNVIDLATYSSLYQPWLW